jgi:hypothetical protein
LQCKHAHWNVKGPNFIALHTLFGQVNEEVEDYIDIILNALSSSAVLPIPQRALLRLGRICLTTTAPSGMPMSIVSRLRSHRLANSRIRRFTRATSLAMPLAPISLLRFHAAWTRGSGWCRPHLQGS